MVTTIKFKGILNIFIIVARAETQEQRCQAIVHCKQYLIFLHNLDVSVATTKIKEQATILETYFLRARIYCAWSSVMARIFLRKSRTRGNHRRHTADAGTQKTMLTL